MVGTKQGPRMSEGLILASLFYAAGILGSFLIPDQSYTEGSGGVFVPHPFNGHYNLRGLILLNSSVILILSIGYVTLGTLTALSLSFNGMVVGSIFREILRENLTGALPCFLFHGPLEITSILISSSVGLSSAVTVIHGGDPYDLSRDQLVYLTKLALLSLIMIISSSVIEYYLSIPCILVKLNGHT